MLSALVVTVLASSPHGLPPVAALPSAIVGQSAKKSTVKDPPLGVWARRDILKSFMSAVIPDSTAPFDAKQVGDPSEVISKSQWSSIKVADVYVIFNYSEYKKGSKVDIAAASKGGVDKLEEVRNVSNIKVQRRQLTVSGVPAIRVRADYKFQGESMVYWTLIAGKGSRMWQVSATGYADAPNLKAIQRVMDSVVLKP